MEFDAILASLDMEPFHATQFGSAYLADSLSLLPKLPDASVDLICTSPPFALLRKKAYGNVHSTEYVAWFMSFAKQFARILKPTGSLVIDIGGTWVRGMPVRSLYHYELVLELCKPIEQGGAGFYLAQELYWYNPAKLPTPAEWVTVRRERVKDAVNTVWWLSRNPHPKANNRRVLKEYSDSQMKLMQNGYKAKKRPSEHDISNKFGKNNNGAIPPNVINDSQNGENIGEPVEVSLLNHDNRLKNGNDYSQLTPVNVISASNTSSNDQYLRLCRKNNVKPHPARFPYALPEFIIGLCTEPDDVVLDPFAGSNMTGYVSETMNRKWIAFEESEEYLHGSIYRFSNPLDQQLELDIKKASQPTLFD